MSCTSAEQNPAALAELLSDCDAPDGQSVLDGVRANVPSTYRIGASSWMFRHTKLPWPGLLQASVSLLLRLLKFRWRTPPIRAKRRLRLHPSMGLDAAIRISPSRPYWLMPPSAPCFYRSGLRKRQKGA